MGLESIPPQLIEPIACLEDLVRDQEAIALSIFRRGRETDNSYLIRWMQEHPDWFEMVRKGRKALEELGINLLYPHEREREPKPKGVKAKRTMCRSCGSNAKRHHAGCKKAGTNAP